MGTLSRKWSGSDPDSARRTCNCVYCGAAVGLVIALAAFFVVSIYYAGAAGLCAGNCTTLSSFMTILLSQPVALAGIVIGAAIGGVYACASCRIRKRQEAD